MNNSSASKSSPMRARLIVAAVGVPVVLVVLIILPGIATAVFTGVVALLAVFELLSAAQVTGKPTVTGLCIISAAGLQLAVCFDMPIAAIAAWLFACLLILFILCATYYEKDEKFNFAGFAVAGIFAGFIIPICLSALVVLRNADNGILKVLIPFGTAFIGDAGALFTGLRFGKRKLAPRTSPKKTVEGAVGGILFSIAYMLIYTGVLSKFFGINASLPLMLGLGLLCGALAQLGDLAFSLIKREFRVKDYSALLPGHGGALDRFDSMVTVAPAVALVFAIAAPF